MVALIIAVIITGWVLSRPVVWTVRALGVRI